MYAIYTRRKRPDDAQRLRERAEKEFFPQLQQAPGFVSMTLIENKEHETLAVMLWERHEDATAFQAETRRWGEILEQVAPLASQAQGEVVMHLTPRTAAQG